MDGDASFRRTRRVTQPPGVRPGESGDTKRKRSPRRSVPRELADEGVGRCLDTVSEASQNRRVPSDSDTGTGAFLPPRSTSGRICVNSLAHVAQPGVSGGCGCHLSPGRSRWKPSVGPGPSVTREHPGAGGRRESPPRRKATVTCPVEPNAQPPEVDIRLGPARSHGVMAASRSCCDLPAPEPPQTPRGLSQPPDLEAAAFNPLPSEAITEEPVSERGTRAVFPVRKLQTSASSSLPHRHVSSS